MAEEIDTIGRVGAVGSSDFTTTQDSTSAMRETAGVAPGNSSNAPAPVQPSPRPSGRQPSAQEIQAAVKQVNVHLATVNRVLELHVDASTGLTIATIRNAQTGAVLQQIPSTDSVHLAQMLAAWSPGKNVLVDLIA